MSNSDYAVRMLLDDGDYPATDITKLLTSNFPEDQSVSQRFIHEAAIVGNTLRPPTAIRRPVYATFMTRRAAVSQLKVIVEGSYRSLWLKLPGLEDSFPKAPNGWLDLNALYDGYGTPGAGRNSNGCAIGVAATGGSGTFVATFGQQSSTYSAHNMILLRIKLERQDVIKGITLHGMVDNPDIVW